MMNHSVASLVAAFEGATWKERYLEREAVCNLWIERPHQHGTLAFSVAVPFNTKHPRVTGFFTDETTPPFHISSIAIHSPNGAWCDEQGRALVAPALLRGLFALGVDIEPYEQGLRLFLTGHEKMEATRLLSGFQSPQLGT